MGATGSPWSSWPAGGGEMEETERRAAERTLRASEERYRALFDAIDEGFQLAEIVVDGHGRPVDYRLLEVNPAFGRMTGIDPAAAVGRTARELVPEMSGSWIEICGRVALHGERVRFENHEPALGRWFDVYAVPVGEPGNGLFSIVFRDITAQKRREANAVLLAELANDFDRFTTAEEIMAAAGERLGVSLGLARCYFAEINEDSGSGVISREWRRPGLEPVVRRQPYRIDELLPGALAGAIRAGETVVVRDAWSDPRVHAARVGALATRAHVVAPMVKDGRCRFVVGVAAADPRDWQDDEIELVREIAARVWLRVERARAEAALRASEEQYRSLFESMDEGFSLRELIRDGDGRVVDYRMVQVNSAFAALTGLAREEVLGRRAGELAATPETAWLEVFERVASTGETARFETSVPECGRWLEVRVFPRGNDRVAALYNDISERKRAEATLAAAAARDALRVTLSDLLRSLRDPEEIQAEAARLLGEHLGVNRAVYAEIQGSDFVLARPFERDVAPVPARFPVTSTARSFIERYRRGEPVVMPDLEREPGLTDVERASLRAAGVIALVGVILIKNGALAAGFGVQSTTPRAWTDVEVELVREVAERIWSEVEHAHAQAELSAREAELQLIMNNAPALVGWVDLDLRYRFVNDPACAYFGLPRERFIGHTVAEVMGRELVDRLRPGIDHALRGEAVRFDIEVPGRDGRGPRLIEERYVPRTATDGSVSGYYFLSLDVTERRRSEFERRQSEERFRAIADLVPDLLWSNDPAGKATWHNRRWLDYTGLAETDGTGDGWPRTIHPDDLEASMARFRAALASGETLLQEHRIRRHDGVYRWFLERAEPMRDEGGRIVSWFGAATDIHEERMARGQLEARVAAATAELRALSRRLIAVQEEERRHLARELHDEIGQVLTGLGFQLGASRPTDAAHLDEARRIVAELTEQVRQLSMDLRPAALDAYGLLPALTWHIERFQKRTGVQVDLRHAGLERRFAAPVEVTAYRVVQEALTNVARHSGVPFAVVQLRADEATLTVSVRDAGRGFDAARAAAGSGLGGMRERVDLLGGALTVDARPAGGVVVTAELPLWEPALEEEAR